MSFVVFCRTAEAPTSMFQPSKVAVGDPPFAWLRVPPSCPSPQGFEEGRGHLDQGFFRCSVSMKGRPTAYCGVAYGDQPVCCGWAMTTSARPSTPSFPGAPWDQARRPGLRRATCTACKPSHPGTRRVVRVSMHPHSLSAFPVRRDGRQVHIRITRLLWVHCCCSPLLCIYRSRSLEPMNYSINPTSC